ncbi:hypothetical protein QFC22_002532 [Naganishia vaughanmartiniae]|uniref:Uncharacterized protein n=1 Tax=Naganishia vaughanmartiniae TaxID=1424756 RepID=A0ACC2XAE6_9TREE|nr:hypothetical protein QFC22_002532 [Naganishia vaughanmartiniae]
MDFLPRFRPWSLDASSLPRPIIAAARYRTGVPPTISQVVGPPASRWRRKFRVVDSRALVLFLLACLALLAWFATELGTLRRDLGYLVRPLWDSPQRAFDVVPHYGAPPENIQIGTEEIDSRGRKERRFREEYCGLFGWQARSLAGSEDGRKNGKPVIVDAALVSTELDMLEIRWKEYEPFVDLFIVIESNMTFAGTPKRKYFADEWLHSTTRTKSRSQFDFIPRDKILYLAVDDLSPDLPSGSFENEATMRQRVTELLHSQASEGAIPPGSLILHSDVDEIISRDTLSLLSVCQGFPSRLHLNVKNYRYGFDFPLPDGGYWRPKVVTYLSEADDDTLQYGHGRAGDTMLADAGWHCSWCFRTLDEMRVKMLGYSHNDRVRGRKNLLDLDKLRERVCKGEEPFGMLPEVFTFRDLVKQTGPASHSTTFRDVPVAVKEDPDRFSYLLADGCGRPDSA